VSLTEIHDFISRRHGINVDFNSLEGGKVEVNYIVSVILTVKEVRNNEVTFYYKTKTLVELMARVTAFFMGKKLDSSIVFLNSKDDEVTVYLNKVNALNHFLKYFSISNISFIDSNVVVLIKPKVLTE
jgi:hypothetical protein